jgi:hypothetical protein
LLSLAFESVTDPVIEKAVRETDRTWPMPVAPDHPIGTRREGDIGVEPTDQIARLVVG